LSAVRAVALRYVHILPGNGYRNELFFWELFLDKPVTNAPHRRSLANPTDLADVAALPDPDAEARG
jgi:hypothetical protein